MQKIKKPLSILLTVLMVLSVFAVVPFTASAETYDSDMVNLSNLQVGDIITADVYYVEIDGCTVVLKGGRYGEGDAYMGDVRVCPDDRESSSIDIRPYNGNFEIMDMDTYGRFVPVDQNGALANKLIVLAKEGSKITIGGYSEADTPEPLNSSVKYRYYNGEYFRNGNTPAANTYKVVSGNKKWTDGNWYVVTEDVTISERITTSGDVNLVLCDGAKLTAKKGISVNGDNGYNPNQNATLNIYSQSGGTGTLFAGTIDGTSTTMPYNPENAAIGGNSDFQNGSITIHGGNITAIANIGAAGIGGGQDEPCSTVTVYGGNVTAGCTDGYGSGIGGGYQVSGGSVNVAGGHVIAYESGGEYAAAIGNMVGNINLTVADGSEIKAGSSDSDATVVASSNDALKKSYVEINAPALPQAYDITWKNGDTVLETDENVAEGTPPEYNGNTPEKAEDENNTYTFAGWSPEITAVTGDVEYTATFTAVPKYDYITNGDVGYKFLDTVAKGVDDTLAEANGYTNLFNFKILGVQKKNDVDVLSTNNNDVRFVTVVNNNILMDADEYGYVFAKFDSKEQARAHADEIQAGGSKVLTKPCTETSNTISGNYGLYNEDTNYKYVTATVNGIGDDTVAARFYIKKGSTYYYADYTNDQNQTYGVCAAAYSDLT